MRTAFGADRLRPKRRSRRSPPASADRRSG
jgi:hypothetical protein